MRRMPYSESDKALPQDLHFLQITFAGVKLTSTLPPVLSYVRWMFLVMSPNDDLRTLVLGVAQPVPRSFLHDRKIYSLGYSCPFLELHRILFSK